MYKDIEWASIFRILSGLPFFIALYPNFDCIICIQSNLEITILQVAVFVKIPFQHINYPYMLRICRPHFMKFKDR